MKVCIVDSRVDPIFLTSVQDDVTPIVLDYENDNFASLLNKIGPASVSSIAYVAHASYDPTYSFFKDSAFDMKDKNTWQPFFDFLVAINGLEYFDFLGCSLASNQDWKDVFTWIEELTHNNIQIKVRASTDATGNLGSNGNWILEDGLVNAKDLYFKDGIESYIGLLVLIDLTASSITNTSITIGGFSYVAGYTINYGIGSFTSTFTITSATPKQFTPLIQGSLYQFQLRDSNGTQMSNTLYVATKLTTTPVITVTYPLTLKNIDTPSLNINFTDPSFNRGVFVSYAIEHTSTQGVTTTTFDTSNCDISGTKLTYNVKNLTIAISYSFKLIVNTTGGGIAISTAVSRTAALPPGDITLTAGTRTINRIPISWLAAQPNGLSVTGYFYSYKKATDLQFSAEVSTTSLTLPVITLTPNTQYNFRITPYVTYSTGVFGRATTSELTSYTLPNASIVPTVTEDDTQYTISLPGAVAGQLYRITAYLDGITKSDTYIYPTVTTISKTIEPYLFTSTAYNESDNSTESTKSLNYLKWTASSSSRNSLAELQQTTSIATASMMIQGLSSVTGSIKYGIGTFTASSSITTAATSKSITGLTPGSLYQFQQYDSTGTPISNVLYVATIITTPAITVTYPLTLKNTDIPSLNINFTDPSFNTGVFVSYEIVQTSVQGTNTTIFNNSNCDVSGTTLTYNVKNLTIATSYSFQLAVNTTGGGKSTKLTAVSKIAAVPPGDITLIPGTRTINRIPISWLAAKTNGLSVTGYFYSYKNATDAEFSAEAITTSLTLPVITLTPNTQYNFRITPYVTYSTGVFGRATTSELTLYTLPNASIVPTVTENNAEYTILLPGAVAGQLYRITAYYAGFMKQNLTYEYVNGLVITGLEPKSYQFTSTAYNENDNSTESSKSQNVVLLDIRTKTIDTSSILSVASASISYNVNYADVVFSCTNDTTIDTDYSGSWFIELNDKKDTLIGVKRVICKDITVYLYGAGSGCNNIFNTSTTVSDTLSSDVCTNKIELNNKLSNKSAMLYAGGKKYWSRPGNWTSACVIDNELSIESIGTKATLIMTTDYGEIPYAIKSGNVIIKNIILDNNNQNRSYTTGFQVFLKICKASYPLVQIDNVQLIDVDFINLKNRGIDVHFASNIVIDGCTQSGTALNGPGIGLSAVSVCDIKNSTIIRGAYSSISMYSTDKTYILPADYVRGKYVAGTTNKFIVSIPSVASITAGQFLVYTDITRDYSTPAEYEVKSGNPEEGYTLDPVASTAPRNYFIGNKIMGDISGNILTVSSGTPDVNQMIVATDIKPGTTIVSKLLDNKYVLSASYNFSNKSFICCIISTNMVRKYIKDNNEYKVDKTESVETDYEYYVNNHHINIVNNTFLDDGIYKKVVLVDVYRETNYRNGINVNDVSTDTLNMPFPYKFNGRYNSLITTPKIRYAQDMNDLSYGTLEESIAHAALYWGNSSTDPVLGPENVIVMNMTQSPTRVYPLGYGYISMISNTIVRVGDVLSMDDTLFTTPTYQWYVTDTTGNTTISTASTYTVQLEDYNKTIYVSISQGITKTLSVGPVHYKKYTFFVDSDGDSYGSTVSAEVEAPDANTPPSGYSTNNTDINDNDPSYHEVPVPPTVSNKTVKQGSLVSILTEIGAAIGARLQYYDSNDQLLDASHVLVQGTYKATQKIGVESAKQSFIVSILANPIVSNQTLGEGSIVANLIAIGTDLTYYNSDDLKLDASDVLVSGTYKVTQTIMIESAKESFTVIIVEKPPTKFYQTATFIGSAWVITGELSNVPVTVLETVPIEDLTSLTQLEKSKLKDVEDKGITYKVIIPEKVNTTYQVSNVLDLSDNYVKILGTDTDIIIGKYTLRSNSATKTVEQNINGTYVPIHSININRQSYNIMYGCIKCIRRSSSRSLGDPYVTTFSGLKYKLPNIVRTYRLLEYPITNDTLYINATVSELSPKEKQSIKDAFHLQNVINGFFYESFYIGTKTNYAIIDRQLNIIKHQNLSNYSITIQDEFLPYECPIQGKTTYQAIIINIEDVVIELRKYSNPQILNGIEVSLLHTNKSQGILNSNINPKHFVIKKIDNTQPVIVEDVKPYNRDIKELWIRSKIVV